MQPQELADLVSFLIQQPASTRYRRIIMFPDNEWHFDVDEPTAITIPNRT